MNLRMIAEFIFLSGKECNNGIMKFVLKLFICLFCFFPFAVKAVHEGYHFQGNHFLVSYCECDMEALSDVDALAAAMQNAVESCGATVLSSSQWVFPPNGLTMVFLLSESHASIHTYPEHGACFVDLFTCGEKCSSEQFDQIMRSYLKPKKVSERMLIRNEGFEEK